MDTKNLKKAIIILVVYLIATLALLLLGYSVQKPKVAERRSTGRKSDLPERQ